MNKNRQNADRKRNIAHQQLNSQDYTQVNDLRLLRFVIYPSIYCACSKNPADDSICFCLIFGLLFNVYPNNVNAVLRVQSLDCRANDNNHFLNTIQ